VPISSFGVIVEGQYDVDFYRILIERISGNNPRIEILEGNGASLPRQFPILLRRFEYLLNGDPVERALVLKDADGRQVTEVEENLSRRVNQEHYRFPRGIRFCAIQQEMETWLLADEGAINAISLARGKDDGVLRIHEPQLENVVNPKERFQSALSSGGLDYTPAVCAEIALQVNLDTLRTRCPTFRRFEQSLQ
jgi:hypothetical protein